MTIPEWCQREGHGAQMRLVRNAGISPTTAGKLAAGERLANYEIAKRVSEATRDEHGVVLVPVTEIWLDPLGRTATS